MRHAGWVHLQCKKIANEISELHRLFGFLLGSTLAGASVYYYILEEYKVSNELLTEDIYVRAALSWNIIGFGLVDGLPRIPSEGGIRARMRGSILSQGDIY
jgi:hypothetical protein